MFSNSFVCCVMVDGKCLEEDRAGNVRIPFGSEYTIFLKNKHDRRATAKVKLDGETVGEFVVNAHKSLELKRPESHNAAFKFVHIDSDASRKEGKSRKNDGTNGLIEVEWKLERKTEKIKYVPRPRKEYIPVPYPVPQYPEKRPQFPWTSPWINDPHITWDSYTTGDPYPAHSFSVSCNSSERVYSTNGLIQSSNVMRSMNSVPQNAMPPDDVGATVDGKETDQHFIEVYVDTENVSTTMRLVLRGYEIDAHDEQIKILQEKKKKLDQLKVLKAQIEKLEREL